MKLTDLNPRWVNADGEGVFSAKTGEPVPASQGVGMSFDCPCGNCADRKYLDFENPISGEPSSRPEHAWRREGETFETLTLSPSILFRSDWGACGWHGFIRDGQIIDA